MGKMKYKLSFTIKRIHGILIDIAKTYIFIIFMPDVSSSGIQTGSSPEVFKI